MVQLYGEVERALGILVQLYGKLVCLFVDWKGCRELVGKESGRGSGEGVLIAGVGQHRTVYTFTHRSKWSVV